MITSLMVPALAGAIAIGVVVGGEKGIVQASFLAFLVYLVNTSVDTLVPHSFQRTLLLYRLLKAFLLLFTALSVLLTLPKIVFTLYQELVGWFGVLFLLLRGVQVTRTCFFASRVMIEPLRHGDSTVARVLVLGSALGSYIMVFWTYFTVFPRMETAGLYWFFLCCCGMIVVCTVLAIWTARGVITDAAFFSVFVAFLCQTIATTSKISLLNWSMEGSWFACSLHVFLALITVCFTVHMLAFRIPETCRPPIPPEPSPLEHDLIVGPVLILLGTHFLLLFLGHITILWGLWAVLEASIGFLVYMWMVWELNDEDDE